MDINKEIEKLEKLKFNLSDLIIRKISVGTFKNIYIVVFQTLVSEDKVNSFILKYFSQKDLFKNKTNVKKTIQNFVPAINLKEIKSSDEIMHYLLNGFTVILSNSFCAAFETKAAIDRSVTESSSEPSTFGPKDALVENYNTNIGLIRKRIKNKNLCLKESYIGTQTNTKIGMLYLSDNVDEDLLKSISKKIESIKCDSLLDSYYIKELIKKENKTLFPTIISKEKPDEIARFILQGKVALIVDNSPNALIIPSFFVDFFHQSEDYYQKPFYVSFVRIIRIIAFFISVLLPGFYIALITIDQQILPTSLLINFATQRDGVPFPAVLEALILMLTFEILYDGDTRVPSSRGTSLSILGALVLGDAAVNAGLVSPIMVIVIALAAICSLLFIYADLQSSIRFWRYTTLFLCSFFGIIGFIVSCTFIIINLCKIKSFGKPYLMPIVPFKKTEAFYDGIIKKSQKSFKSWLKYFIKGANK